MGLNFYEQANPKLWKGRVDDPLDSTALRWHQVVQCTDLQTQHDVKFPDSAKVAILGFKSDEGVKRNFGRSGAALAPSSIRRELANLPCHFDGVASLYDFGNIVCQSGKLEEAQAELAYAVKLVVQEGFFPVLLGGGHEMAFGHYEGLRDYLPGIINLDAHFDLRPTQNGPHSGNSFLKIAEQDPANFNCLYLGIQQSGNTPKLFNIARELGCFWMMAKDLRSNRMDEAKSAIDRYLEGHTNVYVTICADVISAAYAPGVSSPQPFGLHPEIVVELLKHIMRSGKVLSLDIAEVSPRFDTDNRTSKLAAILIFACLNTLFGVIPQNSVSRLPDEQC